MFRCIWRPFFTQLVWCFFPLPGKSIPTLRKSSKSFQQAAQVTQYHRVWGFVQIPSPKNEHKKVFFNSLSLIRHYFDRPLCLLCPLGDCERKNIDKIRSITTESVHNRPFLSMCTSFLLSSPIFVFMLAALADIDTSLSRILLAALSPSVQQRGQRKSNSSGERRISI